MKRLTCALLTLIVGILLAHGARAEDKDKKKDSGTVVQNSPGAKVTNVVVIDGRTTKKTTYDSRDKDKK